VDEIGGLQRAIAYAHRTYATSGPEAEIVVWPQTHQRLSMEEDKKKDASMTDIGSLVDWILNTPSKGLSGTLSGSFFVADETTALRFLLGEQSISRLERQ
jgi:hypothetical protein